VWGEEVISLRSIIDISIRFRLLVVALAAGIMVVGVLQLRRMPVDVLPETSPVVVDVQTEAPGLSGPEVESLVTVPLEKELFEGVMGVTDVTSDSVAGLSAIELHFAPGTNLYQARELVQERLTQAFVLPAVSKPPVMLQPLSSTSDVMVIGLTSPRLSVIDLSVLARWTIVPRLLGLAGVANVSTFGQADRQLQVLVDPARLAASHVTLAQVIETVGNAQLVSPLSYLEASTPGTGGILEDPSQRLTIQPILPFGTPANLAQLPIAGASPGVRLGDVAQVVEGHQPLIGDGQVRGGGGLVLVVQKLPAASVAAVTHEVDQALAGLQPALPGVRIDASLFRQDTYLESALGNLRVALIAAAALAALALIALLLQLRRAFAALAAVILSLGAATGVLYLLGYTFNALVALGLLLALAVVVADAVGAARNPLTRLGAAVLPVAPLFFATGLTAAFLRPAVLAFGLAATVSMVVALTVTPALTSLLGVAGPLPRGEAIRRRLSAGYLRTLDRLVRVPRVTLTACCVVILAVGAGGLALLPQLHPGPPALQDRDLVVRWTGAPGMSLTEMDRMAALASAELLALPQVQDVGATLGRAVSSDQVVNTNSGELWVTIKPGADYGQAVAAVRAIADGTPGMSGTVSTYESDSMSGVLTAAPAEVTVRVYGSDYTELSRLADQLRASISRISGVRGAQVQLPVEQPTLDVEVNLDSAALNGVKPGDVRREAGTLLSGLTVGNFFEQQKVFDVVVWGIPTARDNVSDVGSLLLDTVNGGHVRLGDVAAISVSPEPADIQHEADSRYLDITAQVNGGSAGAVSTAITRSLQRMSFPLEYHAEVLSGSSPAGASQAGTSRVEFVSYVIAALAGILLLVQAASGSWGLALLAFGSLPVSLAGAVLTVFLLGATGSLAAAAGLVAVFAVAAWLAVSVTGRLRLPALGPGEADGEVWRSQARRAAAASAGDVVTAAVVTAAALAPFIVIGDVAGLELLHTAAAVILGGLVTVALVSLFVLPAACLRLGPASAAPGEEASEPDWAAPHGGPSQVPEGGPSQVPEGGPSRERRGAHA
jgi:Cu/Ag efflux pump CusA